MTRCSDASRAAGEPLAGSAPRADVWVIVEHPAGWGDARLARAEHGVRVLMARGPRRLQSGAGGAPGSAVSGSVTPGSAADLVGSHDARDLPAATVPPSSERSRGGSDSTGPVRAWVAHCGRDPVLRVGVLDHPSDVAEWDLAAIAAGSHRGWGAPDPDPLLLVCANGRRDRCCGHSGGRLADELWRGPLAHRVLTCTHLGGHRFAPTALMLPSGSLHGRLDVESAQELLSAAARGSVPADNLRGFSALDEPEQVADAHARRVWGHVGAEPLDVRIRLAGSDRAVAVVSPPPRPGSATAPATDAPPTHTPATGAVPTPAQPMGPAPTDAPLPLLAPTPAPLTITLVRTTALRTLSCGRDPEESARWMVEDPTSN